jgi:hypothetical protein
MLSQYKFCFHEVISKNFFKEPGKTNLKVALFLLIYQG